MNKITFLALNALPLVVAVEAKSKIAPPTTPALSNLPDKIVLDARQTAATFEGLGALSAGASSRLLRRPGCSPRLQ